MSYNQGTFLAAKDEDKIVQKNVLILVGNLVNQTYAVCCGLRLYGGEFGSTGGNELRKIDSSAEGGSETVILIGSTPIGFRIARYEDSNVGFPEAELSVDGRIKKEERATGAILNADAAGSTAAMRNKLRDIFLICFRSGGVLYRFGWSKTKLK